MLILILNDAQYQQNDVFSFEKGLSGQNHSLPLVGQKNPPQQN